MQRRSPFHIDAVDVGVSFEQEADASAATIGRCQVQRAHPLCTEQYPHIRLVLEKDLQAGLVALFGCYVDGRFTVSLRTVERRSAFQQLQKTWNTACPDGPNDRRRCVGIIAVG